MIPGEMLVLPGEIEINADRDTLEVHVENTGDRPIQVGSHYHFHETNSSLRGSPCPPTLRRHQTIGAGVSLFRPMPFRRL